MYDYDSLNESEKAFAYFKKAAEYEWYNEGLGICYEMGMIFSLPAASVNQR